MVFKRLRQSLRRKSAKQEAPLAPAKVDEAPMPEPKEEAEPVEESREVEEEETAEEGSAAAPEGEEEEQAVEEEQRDVEIEEQAQAQAFDCCGLEIPVR